jgi:glycogen operon protein
MLLAGDERWRTQGGNNNAYCQDNPTSWLDWSATPEAADLLELARRLVTLRRSSPVLRQRAFFEGRPVLDGDGSKDLAWFHPAGRELIADDWFDNGLCTIGMYLDGRGLRHRGSRGEQLVDHSYLILLHSGDDPVRFFLPGPPWAGEYETVIDTRYVSGMIDGPSLIRAGRPMHLVARSVQLLRVVRA